MSDVRTGRAFRAIRRRMNLRQSDIAARADVSQQVVSQLERGILGPSSVTVVRRVAEALGASVSIAISWRGPALDRLLDEQHAALVGAASRLLSAVGWEIALEASYSEWGERGSIDVLGWNAARRTLLVVEVKTRIAAVEETLRKHDEKARLAPTIARRRFGWDSLQVRRLLVLPDDSTARRQVARHEAVFASAYPLRGHAVKAALGSPVPLARRAHGGSVAQGEPLAPVPPLDMLLFLPFTDGRGTRRSSVTPERVPRRAPRAVRARSPGPRPDLSTDRAPGRPGMLPEAPAHRADVPRPGSRSHPVPPTSVDATVSRPGGG